MAEAPNFSGNYPLAGERIGPAWREGWDALIAEPDQWFPADRLAEQMAATGVEVKTARNLLASARKHRVLLVRHPRQGEPPRRRSEYRVHPRLLP